MVPGDDSRAAALSQQLREAHAALRQQLREVQAGVDPGSAGSGLLAHCLAFCTALSAHHQGEDDGLFAELLRVRPDIAEVVRKLTEDHQMIAGILTSVRELADEAARTTTERKQAIGRELGGLAAIMESHFSYEERSIGDAINRVQDTGWAAAVFDFSS
jgi:hemerythrin-like domain-containing protein